MYVCVCVRLFLFCNSHFSSENFFCPFFICKFSDSKIYWTNYVHDCIFYTISYLPLSLFPSFFFQRLHDQVCFKLGGPWHCIRSYFKFGHRLKAMLISTSTYSLSWVYVPSTSNLSTLLKWIPKAFFTQNWYMFFNVVIGRLFPTLCNYAFGTPLHRFFPWEVPKQFHWVLMPNSSLGYVKLMKYLFLYWLAAPSVK